MEYIENKHHLYLLRILSSRQALSALLLSTSGVHGTSQLVSEGRTAFGS